MMIRKDALLTVISMAVLVLLVGMSPATAAHFYRVFQLNKMLVKADAWKEKIHAFYETNGGKWALQVNSTSMDGVVCIRTQRFQEAMRLIDRDINFVPYSPDGYSAWEVVGMSLWSKKAKQEVLGLSPWFEMLDFIVADPTQEERINIAALLMDSAGQYVSMVSLHIAKGVLLQNTALGREVDSANVHEAEVLSFLATLDGVTQDEDHLAIHFPQGRNF